MNHSQQSPASRRPVGSGHGERGADGSGDGSRGQHDELYISDLATGSQRPQHERLSLDKAPQTKLMQPDMPAATAAEAYRQNPHHHLAIDAVPNILQPGAPLTRSAVSPSATSTLIHTTHGSLPLPSAEASTASSHLQPQMGQPSQQYCPPPPPPLASAFDYATPSKASLNMPFAQNYDRSSSAASFDTYPPSYQAYTPTSPDEPTMPYLSPVENTRFHNPESQRHPPSAPLGLADIRPRANSSVSDSTSGPLSRELAASQPGPSSYLAPWAVYAFDWCKWTPVGNSSGKVAVGSYLEDGHNFIQILDSHVVQTPQDISAAEPPACSLDFVKVAEATHSYPVTRLLWEPPSSQKQCTDLLATSGDHLRLWSLPTETSFSSSNITHRRPDVSKSKLTPLALLSNSKTPDHTAPLTSLDWNAVSPSLIITSSIDTSCTIWDIPSLTAKTQLIAHDKEVYDVRFCANSVDVFVSCGQDGSVRMFDLRSLEHSTIIYEPTGKEEKELQGRNSPAGTQQVITPPPPLLRLATSPHDTHLLATFAQDSNILRILDVRQPGQTLFELRGHSEAINCIEWSPLRRGTLASGADDCQVLVWDLLNASSTTALSINGNIIQENCHGPVAAWECDYEVANLSWVPHLQGYNYGEWLGVSAGRGIWATRLA